MAWTTPASWTAAEIVTASKLNVHVRDNLAYLKGILDGTVAGNLIVTGNITASGSVTGNVGGSFADLTVSDDATIASDLAVTGNTTLNGTVSLGQASGSPALVFLSDPDTGIGNPAANQFAIRAGGNTIAVFTTSLVELFEPLLVQDNISSTGILTVTPPAGGGSSSGIDTSGNLYTQAGGLNVVGNAAIGGTLTVAGNTVRSGAGARVYHNANQSIANGTAVALAFNSERHDTNGFHDTATNNTRLTVPTGMLGKYEITGHVQWAANADANYRQVRIRLNGSVIIADSTMPALNSASIQTSQPVSTVCELGAGDYVELVVAQASGIALNVLATGNYSPEFTIAAVG